MKGLRRFFAHVIATFIPSKRVSRRVKSLIEYGVVRKMRENRDFRKSVRAPAKFKYNLAIVAIMKNEGPYLAEWIEFHKLLGVEKFYLYDNESSDDTQKILKPYIKSGLVDYTFFPGEKMQLPAYNDCIARHKNETKWLAVIDLDEFLVPVKNDNMTDFLATIPENVAQIIIPWVIFGSNGHKTKPQGLVTKNYTMRAKRNWLYKAIVNPRLIMHMGCHEHDVAGATKSILMSVCRVHHYHCKSWEEYKLKAMRGDAWDGADAGVKKYQMDCFKKHDLNDIYDDKALRFANQIDGILNK